jgi:phospholipid transport system substrate-binding protein
MRSVRFLALAALMAMIVLGPGCAAAAEQASPRAAVEAAVGEGLATFVGSGHSQAERTRLLDGLLRRHSDPALLSASILGRYWGKITPAEQEAFAETFMGYLVSSYSGLLKNLQSGVAVRIDDAVDLGGRYRVGSMVTLPSQPTVPVPVDWELVVAADGRLVIIDVTAEGVSMIRAMREEFASVLRGSGGKIDLLMEALRRKIAENEASNARLP